MEKERGRKREKEIEGQNGRHAKTEKIYGKRTTNKRCIF